MAKKVTISLDDIRNSACAHLNQHLFAESVQKKPESGKKRSKYGNNRTAVDGIVFDSAREANRYKELKILLKAGMIGMLERQVPFELNECGTHSLKYVADFVYTDALTGQKVVEDVKGHRTREYLKKRRLIFKIHKIKIKEV